MLTDITVKGSELKTVLADIAQLIPSGTKSVPVGLSLSKGILTLTCMGICNYEATIPVDSTDEADITIAYATIHDLVPSGEQVSLRLQNDGVSIETSKMTRFLRVAYSVVSKLDYPMKTLEPIQGTSAIANLRTLIRTQLPNLYKKQPPIDICNEVAVLKYGNIWIQVRVLGFPCNCTLTQDCLKILTNFSPKQYCTVSSDTALFMRNNCKLYVPMKKCDSLVNATTVIPKDAKAVQLTMDKFSDNIKLLKSMGCKNVTITLMSDGLSIYGNSAEGNLTLPLGKQEGEFIASFQLPVDLTAICFNLFSGSTLEFLYKDGVLCMRNTYMVMVTRVLV